MSEKSKPPKAEEADRELRIKEFFLEMKKFAADLSGESDRAAVVVAAAKLDQLLYEILQRKLAPCATSVDPLLDGDSPLSTFSSRIELTHRLGLIDAGFTRALHAVRKIRNQFAHELSSTTLAAGSHRDRVRQLMAPIEGSNVVRYLCSDMFPTLPAGPSRDFRAMTSILAGRLEALLTKVEPLSPGEFGLLAKIDGKPDASDTPKTPSK
jgi:hypothetical protein